MARSGLFHVPGDECRQAEAGRTLRLHLQPQFRRPSGPRRAHASGFAGDGGGGGDYRPSDGCAHALICIAIARGRIRRRAIRTLRERIGSEKADRVHIHRDAHGGGNFHLAPARRADRPAHPRLWPPAPASARASGRAARNKRPASAPTLSRLWPAARPCPAARAISRTCSPSVAGNDRSRRAGRRAARQRARGNAASCS